MSESLTQEDILEEIRPDVYTQDYSKKPEIDGIQMVSLKNYIGEDGDFCEVFRIEENGETQEFPSFKIAQINRSKLIAGAIKAWHLHFNQDEVWYVVPSTRLIVGLWDVRDNSKTKNNAMRLTLGGTDSKLLFIPRGVAHGCANFTKGPAELFYFVSNKFDPTSPDEKRIKWDALGTDFWEQKRD